MPNLSLHRLQLDLVWLGPPGTPTLAHPGNKLRFNYAGLPPEWLANFLLPLLMINYVCMWVRQGGGRAGGAGASQLSPHVVTVVWLFGGNCASICLWAANQMDNKQHNITHIKKSNQNGVLNQMRIQIRPRRWRRHCPDPGETRLKKHKLTSQRSVFEQRPHWDCGYKARTTASGAACRMTIRRLRRAHTHTRTPTSV